MDNISRRPDRVRIGLLSLLVLPLFATPYIGRAQAQSPPVVPDWALPSSPTHVQVPPPADFHRPSRNFDTPIGIFDGQSDIGAALVPAAAALTTPQQSNTPSAPPVTTSGISATSSVFCGRRFRVTSPWPPMSPSPTPRGTATARPSWSFARASTTIQKKP